jgi:Flp pilus assembly protein TadB
MNSDPTVREMLEEALNLTAGLSILLMPLLVISLPGVILFLILPAVLIGAAVAIPAALAGAVLAPPYLLFKRLGRRRRAV